MVANKNRRSPSLEVQSAVAAISSKVGFRSAYFFSIQALAAICDPIRGEYGTNAIAALNLNAVEKLAPGLGHFANDEQISESILTIFNAMCFQLAEDGTEEEVNMFLDQDGFVAVLAWLKMVDFNQASQKSIKLGMDIFHYLLKKNASIDHDGLTSASVGRLSPQHPLNINTEMLKIINRCISGGGLKGLEEKSGMILDLVTGFQSDDVRGIHEMAVLGLDIVHHLVSGGYSSSEDLPKLLDLIKIYQSQDKIREKIIEILSILYTVDQLISCLETLQEHGSNTVEGKKALQLLAPMSYITSFAAKVVEADGISLLVQAMDSCRLAIDEDGDTSAEVVSALCGATRMLARVSSNPLYQSALISAGVVASGLAAITTCDKREILEGVISGYMLITPLLSRESCTEEFLASEGAEIVVKILEEQYQNQEIVVFTQKLLSELGSLEIGANYLLSNSEVLKIITDKIFPTAKLPTKCGLYDTIARLLSNSQEECDFSALLTQARADLEKHRADEELALKICWLVNVLLQRGDDLSEDEDTLAIWRNCAGRSKPGSELEQVTSEIASHLNVSSIVDSLKISVRTGEMGTVIQDLKVLQVLGNAQLVAPEDNFIPLVVEIIRKVAHGEAAGMPAGGADLILQSARDFVLSEVQHSPESFGSELFMELFAIQKQLDVQEILIALSKCEMPDFLDFKRIIKWMMDDVESKKVVASCLQILRNIVKNDVTEAQYAELQKADISGCLILVSKRQRNYEDAQIYTFQILDYLTKTRVDRGADSVVLQQEFHGVLEHVRNIMSSSYSTNANIRTPGDNILTRMMPVGYLEDQLKAILKLIQRNITSHKWVETVNNLNTLLAIVGTKDGIKLAGKSGLASSIVQWQSYVEENCDSACDDIYLGFSNISVLIAQHPTVSKSAVRQGLLQTLFSILAYQTDPEHLEITLKAIKFLQLKQPTPLSSDDRLILISFGSAYEPPIPVLVAQILSAAPPPILFEGDSSQLTGYELIPESEEVVAVRDYIDGLLAQLQGGSVEEVENAAKCLIPLVSKYAAVLDNSAIEEGIFQAFQASHDNEHVVSLMKLVGTSVNIEEANVETIASRIPAIAEAANAAIQSGNVGLLPDLMNALHTQVALLAEYAEAYEDGDLTGLLEQYIEKDELTKSLIQIHNETNSEIVDYYLNLIRGKLNAHQSADDVIELIKSTNEEKGDYYVPLLNQYYLDLAGVSNKSVASFTPELREIMLENLRDYPDELGPAINQCLNSFVAMISFEEKSGTLDEEAAERLRETAMDALKASSEANSSVAATVVARYKLATESTNQYRDKMDSEQTTALTREALALLGKKTDPNTERTLLTYLATVAKYDVNKELEGILGENFDATLLKLISKSAEDPSQAQCLDTVSALILQYNQRIQKPEDLVAPIIAAADTSPAHLVSAIGCLAALNLHNNFAGEELLIEKLVQLYENGDNIPQLQAEIVKLLGNVHDPKHLEHLQKIGFLDVAAEILGAQPMDEAVGLQLAKIVSEYQSSGNFDMNIVSKYILPPLLSTAAANPNAQDLNREILGITLHLAEANEGALAAQVFNAVDKNGFLDICEKLTELNPDMTAKVERLKQSKESPDFPSLKKIYHSWLQAFNGGQSMSVHESDLIYNQVDPMFVQLEMALENDSIDGPTCPAAEQLHCGLLALQLLHSIPENTDICIEYKEETILLGGLYVQSDPEIVDWIVQTALIASRQPEISKLIGNAAKSKATMLHILESGLEITTEDFMANRLKLVGKSITYRGHYNNSSLMVLLFKYWTKYDQGEIGVTIFSQVVLCISLAINKSWTKQINEFELIGKIRKQILRPNGEETQEALPQIFSLAVPTYFVSQPPEPKLVDDTVTCIKRLLVDTEKYRNSIAAGFICLRSVCVNNDATVARLIATDGIKLTLDTLKSSVAKEHYWDIATACASALGNYSYRRNDIKDKLGKVGAAETINHVLLIAAKGDTTYDNAVTNVDAVIACLKLVGNLAVYYQNVGLFVSAGMPATLVEVINANSEIKPVGEAWMIVIDNLVQENLPDILPKFGILIVPVLEQLKNSSSMMPETILSYGIQALANMSRADANARIVMENGAVAIVTAVCEENQSRLLDLSSTVLIGTLASKPDMIGPLIDNGALALIHYTLERECSGILEDQEVSAELCQTLLKTCNRLISTEKELSIFAELGGLHTLVSLLRSCCHLPSLIIQGLSVLFKILAIHHVEKCESGEDASWSKAGLSEEDLGDIVATCITCLSDEENLANERMRNICLGMLEYIAAFQIASLMTKYYHLYQILPSLLPPLAENWEVLGGIGDIIANTAFIATTDFLTSIVEDKELHKSLYDSYKSISRLKSRPTRKKLETLYNLLKTQNVDPQAFGPYCNKSYKIDPEKWESSKYVNGVQDLDKQVKDNLREGGILHLLSPENPAGIKIKWKASADLMFLELASCDADPGFREVIALKCINSISSGFASKGVKVIQNKGNISVKEKVIFAITYQSSGDDPQGNEKIFKADSRRHATKLMTMFVEWREAARYGL